ncbi:hypothetical protein JCM33374_g2371 [Metschnikowia sp. JCM 33374]|nr:hypothetical protein JCM33374_g2371 [Metschnikowia sp. JCM 33374]
MKMPKKYSNTNVRDPRLPYNSTTGDRRGLNVSDASRTSEGSMYSKSNSIGENRTIDQTVQYLNGALKELEKQSQAMEGFRGSPFLSEEQKNTLDTNEKDLSRLRSEVTHTLALVRASAIPNQTPGNPPGVPQGQGQGARPGGLGQMLSEFSAWRGSANDDACTHRKRPRFS